MEMTENHNVEVQGNGDNDGNSMLDVEMAGYKPDNARDSLYTRQILDIPRKPVQKSISSHFRENISPTSPTRVTYPDIEMVSPESQRRRRTESPTSQYSPSFDVVSPETIQDRSQTPEPSREIPVIAAEDLQLPERPMSFVSSIDAMSFEGPSTRFEEPRQAPTPPPGDDYHLHQSHGSQDHLLKFPPPRRADTGNWFTRRSTDWWFMEILSCLVSLLSLIVIIIILRVYDNQPSSKWPHSITLNSLLALFTTLAQAGLIMPVSEALSQLKWVWFKEDERPLVDFETFDRASRGPLGGIKLLAILKFEHLATIGAIISILALAISPITQQILSYHQRLVPATTGPLAEASRSDVFVAYNPIRGSSGVPNLSMQQAVKMGLFNAANESIAAATPSCSTGNCTWPDFSSLGICSKVANVTSFLSASPPSGNLSSTLGYMVNSTATLPNGVFLNAGEIAMNCTTPPSVVDGFSVSPVNHSLAFANEPNADYTTISDYFVIWQNDDGNGQGGFGAIEVLVYWCVNTYSTQVQAGVPSTNVTATSVNIGSANASITLPNNDGTNGTYEKYGATALNPTNSNANYTVDGTANSALTTYLANTFRGTYSLGIGGGYTTDAAQALVSALYDVPSLTKLTGQAAGNLQFAGIQNLTQNIATSMTNNIRSIPFTGASATGTTWAQETYVSVSWGWLSFLIILLASSFAFLFTTIIKTRMANVDVLRSSALATMCGLSPDMKAHMGPTELRRSTWQKAQEVKVRLGKGPMGWSLEGRVMDNPPSKPCPWW